jgi:prepilin-type N-terminal cleavage/methylation domain-containing protein
MRKRGTAGFTLIELLVVIAIIAILAAILFPVFATAKKAAIRNQCVSNMGELGKALQMYTDASNGRLPRWYDGTSHKIGSKTIYHTWDYYLFAYVHNTAVFRCPANYKKADGSSYDSGIAVRSYSMPKNITGVRYDQAPRLTMTVMLLEKGATEIFQTSDAVSEWFTQTWGYAQDTPNKFWHGPGKVFLYGDAHAKYVQYPSGPFSYDYPSFSGFSGQPSVANAYGKGYCGYVDSNGAGDPAGKANLPGANIPH